MGRALSVPGRPSAVPGRTSAGPRIRERRTQLGLTQTDLAGRAGISPSYLNLIEKNRRGVAGKVLLALARALDVTPASLTGGPDHALIGDLTEAAAALGADAGRAEELIGGFPDWARAIAALQRENRGLRGAVAALSDRLAHDPFLGQSVHRLLTNATAIRSTTDILADPGDMPAPQRARFLAILAEESDRLAEVAQGLAAYFDRAGRDTDAAATPEEALDRFLDATGHHVSDLEGNGAADAIPALAAALPAGAARRLAIDHLERAAADAAALPLAAFVAAGAACNWDAAVLADQFRAPFDRVFRRLATLPPTGTGAPPMACLQVNPAGHVEMRRPLPGLPLPRHGSACPLWPLFAALTRPGALLATLCALPDDSEWLVQAVALARGPLRFGQTPRISAIMLAVPAVLARKAGMAVPDIAPDPVGPGCRLCPRMGCAARAEPPILG